MQILYFFLETFRSQKQDLQLTVYLLLQLLRKKKGWNIIFSVNATICLHDLHCPATWVELQVSKQIVNLFSRFKPIETEPVWRISQVLLR